MQAYKNDKASREKWLKKHHFCCIFYWRILQNFAMTGGLQVLKFWGRRGAKVFRKVSVEESLLESDWRHLFATRLTLERRRKSPKKSFFSAKKVISDASRATFFLANVCENLLPFVNKKTTLDFWLRA